MPYHIKHNRINIAEGNIHINDMNKINLDQSKDNKCKYFDTFDKFNNVTDTFIYITISFK